MKKHQCARCRRHLAGIIEVRRKSGSRKTLCPACIETLSHKGARLAAGAPR